MLKNTIRNINNRLDETSPKVYSHADWDHGSYNFDSASYNYDNYEVTPIEEEQSAYLSMCALADYSQGAVGSLGSISAGSVENVHLDGMETHKGCLASIGSTMETTLQNMGNALNVRYTAEMEAAGLFGGQEGEVLDLAGYLRGIASEHSAEILDDIANFGQNVGNPTSPLTSGPQYDESIFTDPEKLAATYNDISQKDPSTWTQEEKIIMMAYYDDLAGRYATAEEQYFNAGANDWMGSEETDKYREIYSALKSEKKELETLLKTEGLMDYSTWEKGWRDIKEAGKALVGEGADVFDAVKEGDWKGAWQELNEFNSQLAATGAVVAESATSGVLKIGEWIDDGATIVGATIASIPTVAIDFVAGTDLTGQMWDATMDDVARDKIGEAREWFYEGTPIGQYINDNSALKWDSDGAQIIMDTTTKAGEVVIAGGVTVATGGAAAPLVAAGLGFLEGTGQEAERRFNLTDENGNYTNRSAKDVVLSYLKGAGKASEWYMYGDVTSGILNNGVEAAAKGVFTGNNAKDALFNMVKKPDFYIDTAASAANATTTRLTTGKWDWKEIAFDLGLNVLGNYGAEYLTASSANKAIKQARLNDGGETFFDRAYGKKGTAGATPKLPSSSSVTPKLPTTVGATPPITYYSSNLDPSKRQLAESLDNFYKNDVVPGYHKEFDGYLDPARIEDVKYANSYETNYDFQNFRTREGDAFDMGGSGGFNEGASGRSHINMDLTGYPDYGEMESHRILAANATHENIHGLGIGPNGEYGIKEIIKDPVTGQQVSTHHGLNETFTEYLTERVATKGGYYPTKPYCGYQPSVDKMKTLVDSGVITPEDIKQMYFVDHSPQVLVDKVDQILGPGYGKNLVDLFDYGIGGSATQKQQGLAIIDKYVQEIVRRTV